MPTQNDMIDYIKNMKVIKSNKELQASGNIIETKQMTVSQEDYVGPVAWGSATSVESTVLLEDKNKIKITPKIKKEESIISEKPKHENIMIPTDVHDLNEERPYKLTKEYVIKKLKEYEKEEVQKRTTYEKKTINAYDLVGCIRKSYYAIKGIEEKPKPNSYAYGEIVQAMGNACHDIIQKRLPSEANELKIKITDIYDITINVRTDILWNKDVVVEIKTKDVVPKNPEPEHIVQAMIYAYLLNTYHGYNISLVQVLYIARGKVGVEIFDVPITPDYMEKVGNKIQRYTSSLMEFVKQDMPPPMDHQYISTKSCMFCNYEYECKKFKPFTNI